MKSKLETNFPDQVNLTFGVSVSMEGGIPLITKATGDATFTVKAKWKRKKSGKSKG